MIDSTHHPQPASLASIRQRIAEAERRFGREPGSVSLIAVSKTRSDSEIAALARQGQRRFGENYLQEALPKLVALRDLGIEWHFIGRVQSNKTREIAENFDWVHTLDRLKVAQRLDAQRLDALPPLNVCVEVNISGEGTKAGVSPEELPALFVALARCPRLKPRGLMALPAPATDFEQQRAPFRRLAGALSELRRQDFDLDTLSMGTTDDFEAAIAEGATLVRLGTALFGPRPGKE
jgi:pyridoxal phosphate enzyme (YggS family)